MSVEHLAVVLHHSKAKGTAKLVLLGIANHQGDGGSWPSVSRLATYANVTERNVQKALSWLVSAGEVSVTVQAGGDHRLEDHQRPNRYEVLVVCPQHCDHTPQHRDTRKLAGPQLPALPVIHRGVDSDTPPLSQSTPPPVSDATPKPPTRTTNYVSASTTDRARRGPICDECSAIDADSCAARQRKLAPADRHPFRPVHDNRRVGWTSAAG